VFKAFSDPTAKAAWFGGPKEWQGKHTMDFRIGGVEISSGGPPGGTMHYYEARYLDIVPNERIITSYWMSLYDVRISVSVATVEITPHGKGTKLTLTEMGAFLDGHDPDAAMRRTGTEQLLDALGRSLAD